MYRLEYVKAHFLERISFFGHYKYTVLGMVTGKPIGVDAIEAGSVVDSKKEGNLTNGEI